MNELEKSILKTIAYYDIFDYPLTLVEVWKWIYADKKYSLLEVETALSSGNLEGKISSKNGFYFLRGKEKSVITRQKRYNFAETKYKLAIRVAKWLRLVPFIKMIAVCNNLAYSNAEKSSDIDFFIVVRHGRLWLSRFLTTAVVHILGKRRYGRKITDRICLSFYISDEHRDLKSLMIEPADPYFIYWFSQLVPIYDRQGEFDKLCRSNEWVKKCLPNIFYYKSAGRRFVQDVGWSLFIKKSLEILLFGVIGNFAENRCRNSQKSLMESKKQSKLWEHSTAVMVSDKILKFHEKDQRRAYRMQLEQSLSKLL